MSFNHVTPELFTFGMGNKVSYNRSTAKKGYLSTLLQISNCPYLTLVYKNEPDHTI